MDIEFTVGQTTRNRLVGITFEITCVIRFLEQPRQGKVRREIGIGFSFGENDSVEMSEWC